MIDALICQTFFNLFEIRIQSSNVQTVVNETLTDSSYITKLTIGSITIKYTFVKMSATKIRVSSNGVSLYYDKK